MRLCVIILAATCLMWVCAAQAGQEQEAAGAKDNLKVATFAAGCFWCVESDFEKLPGVDEVISGYAGGTEMMPTYEQVSSGTTGYLESVQVHYDPAKISYAQLLDWFWRHVDPTDPDGSFVDRGKQYRSAIFYGTEEEKKEAEASKAKLAASGRFDKPIVTEIRPLTTFYPAEAYHQDYHKNHALKYNFYRYRSGRDQFLDKVWGKEKDVLPATRTVQTQGAQYVKPSKEELKKILTPMQYKVTQEEGTEPPYKNEYWNNHAEGIYVDILSGEVLFSSTDKYESGTGWPSFTKPLEPDNLVEKEDRSFFTVRTETRSKHGDNHIGHVFDDGPPPSGLRYCMNSAALRFVPKEDMEKEGYGDYLYLFK